MILNAIILLEIFMKYKKIIVENDASVLEILESSLRDYSRKKLKSFIKYRMVEVDGRVETNSSKILKKGSLVTLYFDKKVIPKWDLNILYEDDDLIVIDKPAGLLSVANSKEKEVTAFRIVGDYLKSNNKNVKVFVVHRLDQGTSGVLMFAKNMDIKETLQKDWNLLVKKREYVAVVEGVMKGEGTFKSYLTMNKAQIVYSTHDTNGWYAVTHYKAVKSGENMTYLEVNIDTGRRNQIRVHMSEAGHPVVGDKKYGSRMNPIGRLALHASKLWIKDPRNGKMLKLETSVPKEISNLVRGSEDKWTL